MMPMPDLRRTIRDEKNNVTDHVMAYRPLTRGELIQSVRMLHAQPTIRRRKKPLKNEVFTILTVQGATTGL